MISSFFDKTNPINFLAVVLIFSTHYWFWSFSSPLFELSTNSLLMFAAVLTIVIFSIFLVEFMIKKNQISTKNTYGVLIFVLLFGIFAPVVYQTAALLSLFFLLLALRKILSIRSLISIKLKIFDASFWILVASFFDPFALYFFLILASGIYFYQYNKIKNWLVIIPAIGAYVLILFAYMGIDEALLFLNNHYELRLNFSTIVWDLTNLKLSLFVLIGIIAAFATYSNLKRSLKGKLISTRLVLLSFIVASIIAIGNSHDNQLLVFALFPASVLIANALESVKKRWIKDLVFFVFLALPFVIASI